MTSTPPPAAEASPAATTAPAATLFDDPLDDPETRLANQNKDREAPPKSIRRKPTHDALPTINTPKDVLVRILTQLDSYQLPPIADVALILKPPKLGRRKDVLRRILNEHFDLRGKCVSADDPSKELLFATQCSIDELGAFVLLKMQERLASDLP
jgi:hypothetical protein